MHELITKHTPGPCIAGGYKGGYVHTYPPLLLSHATLHIFPPPSTESLQTGGSTNSAADVDFGAQFCPGRI